MNDTKPITAGIVTSMWELAKSLRTSFIDVGQGFSHMSLARVNTCAIDVFKESALHPQMDIYFRSLAGKTISTGISGIAMGLTENAVAFLCDQVEQQTHCTIPPLVRGAMKAAAVMGIGSALGTSVVPYATSRAFSMLFPAQADELFNKIFSLPPPATPVPAAIAIVPPPAPVTDKDINDDAR